MQSYYGYMYMNHIPIYSYLISHRPIHMNICPYSIYIQGVWCRVGRLDSFSDAEINFPSRLRDSIFSLSGHANEADNPFTIPSFVDGNYNFHDLEDVHMWLVPYVRGYNPWWCESPLSCFSMRQSVIDNVPLFTGIYKEKDTRAMTLKELILINNFVLFLAG